MQDIYFTIFALMTALASWALTALTLRLAPKMGLVHQPNHRSSHTQITPHGGGLGMMIAGSLALIVLAITQTDERFMSFTYISCGLGIALATTSLLDDIRPLEARYRLGIQTIIACLLLWAIKPDTLPAFGILSSWLLATLLVIVGLWWINLFNFMDGIDGIASVQALCMLSGAAIIATLSTAGSTTLAPLWQVILLLIAAIIGFLKLNWSPARIFMGDVGSTWLAFMLLVVALGSIQAGWMLYETWIILGALFVTDASVTLLRRVIAGERWYEAHRSHAYQHLSNYFQQKFENRGSSDPRSVAHRQVNYLAALINMFWLLPLALLSTLQPQLSWLAVFTAYVPLITVALWLRAGRN